MDRKVFTYKDIEEARAYIGKKGIFSYSLEEIESGGGHVGILSCVFQTDYQFEKDGGDSFQFFSPDPEPVEIRPPLRWLFWVSVSMFVLSTVELVVTLAFGAYWGWAYAQSVLGWLILVVILFREKKVPQ